MFATLASCLPLLTLGDCGPRSNDRAPASAAPLQRDLPPVQGRTREAIAGTAIEAALR